MNNLTKFKFRVPFSAWLFRIASNEVIQYKDKSKQRTVQIQTVDIQDIMKLQQSQRRTNGSNH